MRRIGSHCTSGDERSRSVATQIATAELISQSATMRHPCALLPAIIACHYWVRCICGTQQRPRALLTCYPYVLATRHLLSPPATSAAAACFVKTRPEVARVWRPSWGRSEQSDFGRFGRSLARTEHEASSFHIWHKPLRGAWWGDTLQLLLLYRIEHF